MRMARRRSDLNMTEGSIWKILVKFSVPLLFGLLFQQMYNMVDSVVVGNFVGKDALAAVGSVGPILNTVLGIFSGFSTGASVVISQFFGANNKEMVHKAAHTIYTMTLMVSAGITVIGLLIVDPMLSLMQTPADVYPMSRTYLTIYMAGISGVILYNMGAGILRAVGDSKHPLYFLIISAVTNTLLDLIFVVGFDMGVAGVAYATILSQLLSAVLVIITLMRAQGAYRLVVKDLCFSGKIAKQIVNLGIPTALQMGVTAFSNVFVQGYINAFGSAAMAAWSSYGKIDALTLLPAQCLAMASTSFVGQNLGAGNISRAKQGTRCAVWMSLITSCALQVPVIAFAPQLVSLFNADPEVIAYGAMLLRVIGPVQSVTSPNQVYASALRGAGDTRAPMIIMLSSFVVIRQIYLFLASRLSSSFLVVALGYPLGWVFAISAMFLYYTFSGWGKKSDKIRKLATEKE